jgi:hypothetical protein
MRMRVGILLAVVVFAVAAYLEFGRDIRSPRSAAVMAGAVGTNHRWPTERYIAITAAMKAKYGEKAETWLNGNEGVTKTKVNGEVVATEQLPSRFLEAVGVLLVGAGPGAMSIFPFQIGPDRLPDAADKDSLVTEIQNRFGTIFRAGAMDFSDNDFSIQHCRNMSASDLGLRVAGPLLELGKTALCVVTWRRAPSASMLVGVTIADGGWWIRPFARGVCGTLARAWLDKITVVAGGRLPNYVACILADRPASRPAALSDHIYEVRKDATLALIE